MTRSIGRALRNLRWWWWVGVLWLGGYAAIVGPLSPISPIRRAMVGLDLLPRLAALTPILAGIAWLVVIAPRLEARTTRFSERWTGKHKSLLCRVFAWAPLAIFGVVGIQYVVVWAFDIDDFGWFDGAYGWWLLLALALSVFYGRAMGRGLDRRVRAAAAQSGVRYACNYSLTGLAGDRCPECGERIFER